MIIANPHNDYLVRATAHDGLVRAFAIDATSLTAELRQRHGTDPAVTAALGRLSIGALLLGATLKEEEHSVTLRLQGDGPASPFLAAATGAGEVRSLVTNPRPDVDQVRDGKLNVSGVVGRSGRLSVTRDLGMRQPYFSTVELVSGEVGEDLAYYLARSEQVPSAVGIGVFVRSDGSVEAAGGFMLQLMPGLGSASSERIEEVVRTLPHPTTMLRQGDRPEDILRRIFARDYEVLDRMRVRFHCPCTRDRAERALRLLGAEALDDMIREHAADGAAELSCQFCNASYTFPLTELAELRTRTVPESRTGAADA
jgi:molecular chaperone Hsp33